MDTASMGAIRAYSDALKRLQDVNPSQEQGTDAAADGTGSFADMVKDVVEEAAETTAQGEKASIDALAGGGNMVDVVGAVTNAEVTLQTVVTVRDKIIQAYQDIIKMPI